MEELMSQSVFWQEWSTLANWAIFAATLLYVGIVALTLWYVRGQFEEARGRRKFDAALTVFRELQTQEARRARRYIYERIPWDIHGVPENELITHLVEAEEALTAFDNIGYLIEEGHIDPVPIIDTYWLAVWKCWKKTERLIRWIRRKRNEPTHFKQFEYLFSVCDAHRAKSNYEEPIL